MKVKRIINDRYGKPDRMSMDWSLSEGREAREGMRAFAEKRSPAWVPRKLHKAAAEASAAQPMRALWPPSTGSITPVMKRASSEARNSAA